MGFRSFYFRVALRITALCAAVFLFAWCIFSGLYFRSAYAFLLVFILAAELVSFINRFNRNLKFFLESIAQRDFSMHFSEASSPTPVSGLSDSLNRITGIFRAINSEKEVNHRYLEMLVRHISIGILSYDEDGKIHLLNDSFLQILGRPSLANLEHLRSAAPDLHASVVRLPAGDSTVLRYQNEGRLVSLALGSSDFVLEGKKFRLISIQNITNELNAQEMESWQKLIRVLTHEIMNSMAPVISLSSTLFGIASSNARNGAVAGEELKTLVTGLDAIRVRSEGLHYFTSRYRELTHLPAPAFEAVDLAQFAESTVRLLMHELDARRIAVNISGPSAHWLVDANLMQQVLINLLGNAIEALENIEEPHISVGWEQNNGRTTFSVRDNGPGIDPDVIEKVFIPFFTTKKTGSGIGLALARQIVNLHKGDITVESVPGRTVFTVTI